MPHLLDEDMGEFINIQNWGQLCAKLYKRWQQCRAQIPVSPHRDYDEEDAVAALEKQAQSYLIAVGIHPYGLKMKSD